MFNLKKAVLNAIKDFLLIWETANQYLKLKFKIVLKFNPVNVNIVVMGLF